MLSVKLTPEYWPGKNVTEMHLFDDCIRLQHLSEALNFNYGTLQFRAQSFMVQDKKFRLCVHKKDLKNVLRLLDFNEPVIEKMVSDFGVPQKSPSDEEYLIQLNKDNVLRMYLHSIEFKRDVREAKLKRAAELEDELYKKIKLL